MNTVWELLEQVINRASQFLGGTSFQKMGLQRKLIVSFFSLMLVCFMCALCLTPIAMLYSLQADVTMAADEVVIEDESTVMAESAKATRASTDAPILTVTD